MITKQAKVSHINAVIDRDQYATASQCRAIILANGTIQYTKLSPNKRYIIRTDFMGILTCMEGANMRELHQAYGRKKSAK